METLTHLTVDVTSDFVGIYINNLETDPPLRHFTDQTTEATISKFGPCVLYSIRMKMEIIKSVLIRGFFYRNKTLFFLYQPCILKICFVLIHSRQVLILPIRAVLINAIIRTGKTLALTIEGLSPLFRIARKSLCKFYTTIELSSGFGTVY